MRTIGIIIYIVSLETENGHTSFIREFRSTWRMAYNEIAKKNKSNDDNGDNHNDDDHDNNLDHGRDRDWGDG